MGYFWWWARESSSAFLRVALTTSSAYMAFKIWPVLSFIAEKILSDNTKMRHRQLEHLS